jgi:hypothetical protein
VFVVLNVLADGIVCRLAMHLGDLLILEKLKSKKERAAKSRARPQPGWPWFV